MPLTLRLHQAGSGLYLKYVSLFQISPFSSRALPGTQPWGQADRQHRSDFSKAVPCKKVSTILKLVAPQCWRQLTLVMFT
jgi:hypothetical protein